MLKNQSLSVTEPTSISQFNHHLSLLDSSSENQRRDSLAYLTTVVSSGKLSLPIGLLINRIRPLFLDNSEPVRLQLNKLLQALPAALVPGNVDPLILHIRAGMLDLSRSVRTTSLDAYQWLLKTAGKEAVGSPGGWGKMMQCFLGMLGWQRFPVDKNAAHWSEVSEPRPRLIGRTDIFAKQLQTFTMFLDVGLQKGEPEPFLNVFPLAEPSCMMIPPGPNPFQHLNLFGPPRDELTRMYQDQGERRRIFEKYALSYIDDGLEQAKREGGEVGRAAAAMREVINTHVGWGSPH